MKKVVPMPPNFYMQGSYPPWDPAQRQNPDQKHQVWPQWLSKAKSCRCQSHSLKPQLTCSDGPQHGLRWSTQPVDEAELAAGRV
eukprot:scaffold72880_cov59-Phaeocystis_antarctica.AAC.1